MKIKLIFLLSIAVLIVLIVTALFLSQVNTKTIRPINEVPSPEPTQVVGGDRDEHGCIGSAGYTWCEDKKKCLRSWEELCTEI